MTDGAVGWAVLNYTCKVSNGYTATLWLRRDPVVTGVTSVAKSHCVQTARVAEGLPDSRWEYDTCKMEFGYFQ